MTPSDTGGEPNQAEKDQRERDKSGNRLQQGGEGQPIQAEELTEEEKRRRKEEDSQSGGGADGDSGGNDD